MRRMIAVVLLASFFGAGCYTMKYQAPAGGNISVLSEQQPAAFKKEVKVWYALWGLVPMSDNNSAAGVIAQEGLKDVRVKTQIKFVDGVIGVFTGIVSIVPATMTIEGNK